jgi:hypothetical protein
MGFLDDAIREHLDLKRRRGADPTEIERAEREALGPVRRDPLELDEAQPGAPVVGGEPPGAYDQAAEHDYEEYEAEPARGGGEEALAEGELFAEEEPFVEDEPVVEEHPAAPPLPADTTAGDETVEYDVEETFTHERDQSAPTHAHAQPDDEDVLEETPEFLQDAPEHDRLWFEQRPPKDFDFDD